MASGDTIRLTSTRSVGDSEGEAAVGSYKRTMKDKLLSQGRKLIPKSRNLMRWTQCKEIYIETQIQLSKVREKKMKAKRKRNLSCVREPL